MKKITLFASLIILLFAYSCGKCPQVATYLFNDKEKEWFIYKEGQVITYTSNLGNDRIYTVGKIAQSIKEDKSASNTKPLWGPSCPTHDYYYERFDLPLYSTNDTIVLEYIRNGLQNNVYPDVNFSIMCTWDICNPIHIDASNIYKNQDKFINNSPIENQSNTYYLSSLIVNNKVYKNVYKNDLSYDKQCNGIIITYYQKDSGIIRFETSNEIWELKN